MNTFSPLRRPLLIASLGAALGFGGCQNQSAPPTAESRPKPVPVKTVAVTEESVQKSTLQPATVHAYHEASLQARATGYVKELRVDIGDHVEAGAVLAVIDVPELEQQRKILQARLERLKAEEQRSQAGVDLAEAQIQSDQARLEQAKSEVARVTATLAAAEAEFSRTQDLVQRQSLEPRMLDESRKRRDSELANRDAVASAIRSAEAEVTVARARKAAAESDLLASKAQTAITQHELEELETRIRFATLTAPFTGMITQRHVDPGDLVQEGHGIENNLPLFVISQVDRVRVRIPVPETEAAYISQGDDVSITFPMFPGEKSRTATVSRFSGRLDPATRTMLIEVDLPNEDRKLLPGMFGQATISLSQAVATRILPARAVRFEESGAAYVYLVKPDDTVAKVPVSVGADTGESIEIVTGLDVGQQVVDAHLARFSEGQTVERLPGQ